MIKMAMLLLFRLNQLNVHFKILKNHLLETIVRQTECQIEVLKWIANDHRKQLHILQFEN